MSAIEKLYGPIDTKAGKIAQERKEYSEHRKTRLDTARLAARKRAEAQAKSKTSKRSGEISTGLIGTSAYRALKALLGSDKI